MLVLVEGGVHASACMFQSDQGYEALYQGESPMALLSLTSQPMFLIQIAKTDARQKRLQDESAKLDAPRQNLRAVLNGNWD